MPEKLEESLGSLIQQLLALEFGLRLCLAKNETCGASPVVFPVHAIPGDAVPLSAITDYSTLGALIDRYNSWAKDQGKREISTRFVELRDAIAHGRLCKFDDGKTPHDKVPWTLVKFSKPARNGQTVNVTFRQEITREWVSEQLSETRLASGMLAAEFMDLKL